MALYSGDGERLVIPGVIIPLLLFLAGNLFTFACAILAWKHCRTERPSLDLLTFAVLWVCITAVWTLLLGSAGLLRAWTSGSISFVLLFMLVASCRRSIRLSISELWFDFRSLSNHGSVKMLWFCMGVLIIRQVVHILFQAPYVYDTLTYHLPKVADWIQQGRIVAMDTPVVRSYWPANFELLQAWSCVFFHHDIIVEAPGLPFYLLAVGSVAVIARALGVSHSLASLTALAYATTPVLLQNAVTCKNDIAITAVFLYLLAHLIDAGYRGLLIHKRLAVLICCGGFAFGSKPTIVFMMPGALLIAGWAIWRQRKSLSGALKPDNWLSISNISLSFAGIYLAVFWYIRNFIKFGNPFYPVPSKLFEATSKVAGQSGLQQGGFSWESMSASISSMLSMRIYDLGRWTPDVSNNSGWGWFVFACGFPAFMLTMIRWKPFRLLGAGMVLSLLVLFGFVATDPWNMRFVSWFPAVFAIAFAGVLMMAPCSSVRQPLLVLACLCVALNVVGSLGSGYWNKREWLARFKTPLWRQEVWANQQDSLGRVPKGETLGYIVHGDHWVYPFYKPDFSQRIMYVDTQPGENHLEAMKRLNVDYLYLWDGYQKSESFQVLVQQGELIDLGRNVFKRRTHE